MAVKVHTTEGLRLLPLPSEIADWTLTELKKYMPLAGGIFVGDIQIPARSAFTLEDARDTYPATEGQLKTAYNALLSEGDIRWAERGHVHANATHLTSGFMYYGDKIKLDSIILKDIEEIT